MEATATPTLSTTVPTTVHVYYDIKADKLVGDIDIILLDASGVIMAQTDATADGLASSLLLEVVNAQLAVFAGLAVETDHRTPQQLFRNFDGRCGYIAAAGVREAVR